MDRVKVAIVGLGTWGDIHAMAYTSSEAADLVCVCDLDEGRAKAMAAKYHIEYTTKSQEIANDSEIQIVSVTTPDFAHYGPVMQMLEAGKNVIVEKPLATSLPEAEAMTRKAQEKGVRLMTDFQLRWNPPFITAKQTVESGKIGKPVMAYSRQSNRIGIVNQLPWAARSGPHWFLLPHAVDLVRWLLHQEAREVFARARKEVLVGMGFDTYDAIQAQIVFEDSFATFESAWILPNSWPKGADVRLDLVGTKGKLESRQDRQGIEVAADAYETPAVLGHQFAYGVHFGFFKEPILHFVDCVRKGVPCVVDIEDGLAVTRIITAIVKSIETGAVVHIA